MLRTNFEAGVLSSNRMFKICTAIPQSINSFTSSLPLIAERAKRSSLVTTNVSPDCSCSSKKLNCWRSVLVPVKCSLYILSQPTASSACICVSKSYLELLIESEISLYLMQMRKSREHFVSNSPNYRFCTESFLKRKSPQTLLYQRLQAYANDGPDWSRTSDPHLVEVVLSQLSYKTDLRKT